MTKLCPRGKAAAKRKFKVYPSAYANAYASKICAGKIKDPSGVKRKDFRGSKAEGGRIGLKVGLLPESEKNKTLKKLSEKKKSDFEIFKKDPFSKFQRKNKAGGSINENINPKSRTSRREKELLKDTNRKTESGMRRKMMGGGLMEATTRLKRQGLKGGGICTKGMNRDAVGKNS